MKVKKTIKNLLKIVLKYTNFCFLVFNSIDKVILTLFNEPSLGLYYTQQHIDKSLSTLLYNLVYI